MNAASKRMRDGARCGWDAMSDELFEAQIQHALTPAGADSNFGFRKSLRKKEKLGDPGTITVRPRKNCLFEVSGPGP